MQFGNWLQASRVLLCFSIACVGVEEKLTSPSFSTSPTAAHQLRHTLTDPDWKASELATTGLAALVLVTLVFFYIVSGNMCLARSDYVALTTVTSYQEKAASLELSTETWVGLGLDRQKDEAKAPLKASLFPQQG